MKERQPEGYTSSHMEAFNNPDKGKLPQTERAGAVRRIFAEFSPEDTITSQEEVAMLDIPAGARILYVDAISTNAVVAVDCHLLDPAGDPAAIISIKTDTVNWTQILQAPGGPDRGRTVFSAGIVVPDSPQAVTDYPLRLSVGVFPDGNTLQPNDHIYAQVFYVLD